MASPTLGITHLTIGQTQKEAAVNNAINTLESSLGSITVAAGASPQLLSESQRFFGLIVVSGTLSADHVLEIPSNLEHSFIVENATAPTYSLTVRREGQSTGVTIPYGCQVPLRRTGSNYAVDDRHNLTRPRVRAHRSTSQSISASTWTTINFDAEQRDVSGSFNTSTHEFTAPADGVYLVSYRIGFTSLTGIPNCAAGIAKNGTRIHKSSGFEGLSPTSQSLVGFAQVELAAGDTVTIEARQDGSGSANIQAGSDETYVHIACIQYT